MVVGIGGSSTRERTDASPPAPEARIDGEDYGQSPMARRLDSPAARATILVGVIAAIVLSLAVPLRQYIRQADENRRLAEGITAQEQRVSDLERRAELWQDPAYVTDQARQRLHFVFPGEVGYIVLGEGERPLTGPDVRSQDNGDGWYSRLWDSVRTAGE